MKKTTLLLFCYALITNILCYLNVDAKIFFIFTMSLIIICNALINKIVVQQIMFETEDDYLTALKTKKVYLQKKTFFNSCNSVGVMFLDINNLKATNDTYGHAAGDELIVSVAKVIKKHTIKGVFSYRFGGDEFVMIFTNITKDQFLIFKELLLTDISKIKLNLASHEVSVAVGQSYADNQIDIEKVLQEADDNMYEVKKIMKTKK